MRDGRNKRHLAAALVILAAMSAPDTAWAQTWPDGTPIDRWFTKGATAVRKESKGHRYLITNHGAVRDSTILQTEAIQRVIDLAAADGGGTIVIPEGTFLTASLFFKPGTKLLLSKGARLKGSDDISDYQVVPVHIEGVIQPYIAALINVYGTDGFSISGEGTVDGNGLRFWRDFWTRRKVNPECTNLEALRPRLFYAANCSNVTLEGITLKDPGFWTTHFYKCNRVRIKDLTISAPSKPVPAPSSDGIDIDACTDVHISGCRMRNNDDLIAIKGGKGPWADQDPDNGTNSNILIEGCAFGHGHSVLTFGSECIGGRNVIMRDCKVDGAAVVFKLKMRPDTPQTYEHILVENVTGTAGTMVHIHPWTQFFDLKGRKDIPKSYGRDITVRNCSITCTGKRIDVEESPEQFELDRLDLE